MPRNDDILETWVARLPDMTRASIERQLHHAESIWQGNGDEELRKLAFDWCLAAKSELESRKDTQNE
jgi:hypothetical protein